MAGPKEAKDTAFMSIGLTALCFPFQKCTNFYFKRRGQLRSLGGADALRLRGSLSHSLDTFVLDQPGHIMDLLSALHTLRHATADILLLHKEVVLHTLADVGERLRVG